MARCKIQDTGCKVQNAGIVHRTSCILHLANEKGIALAMVLVLSLIALTIVGTLIYLVIQGTNFSGFHKRYASALDAGFGGVEIAAALISNRGQLLIPGIGINLPNTCLCGLDPDPYDENYSNPSPDTCLCRKLCIPPYKSDRTYNWNLPDCSASLNPIDNPDFRPFPLSGFGTNYQVFVKIVDTTKGYTDLSGEDLGGTCVVCSDFTFKGPPAPYLYRIEIDSIDSRDDKDKPKFERGRLSVLYAY
ncbi:MAG: hypothetical protein AB1390_01420 [Nitrospirota bacterium]